MARFDRLEVYNRIFSDGMVPLFYSKNKEEAKLITEALFKGGSRILEFTNRGEGALEVFSDLVTAVQGSFPEMVIGAGTVTDAPTAALFIAYGADFIVGPNFNEETARLCNKKRIPYIPGVATINEIINAEEFGAEIVKVFPGSTLGPKFIEALKGPLPKTKVMVTGGVTVDEVNLGEWFKAGVCCVGMGSQLVSKITIQEKNYGIITDLTLKALSIIKNVKK